MSVSAKSVPATSKRPASLSFLKLAGPGLVVAATGIGSGDVVAATVGGARYGVILLWAIAVGAFQVCSERRHSALALARENRARRVGRAPAGMGEFYFSYTSCSGRFAVTAALTNATGLGIPI